MAAGVDALTARLAERAGFRACKRCLPGAAPGSPEWDLRGDVAGRAMRLIEAGVVDREGVPGLARRLGYGERQLRRLLLADLGATPLSLARAGRAGVGWGNRPVRKSLSQCDPG